MRQTALFVFRLPAKNDVLLFKRPHETFLHFILLLLSSAFSALRAQNYEPFSDTVTKRFHNVQNSADDDYFFYADTAWLTVDSLPKSPVHTAQCL